MHKGTQTETSGRHEPSREPVTGAELLLDTIIPYQINRLCHRMNKLLEKDLRTHDLSMASWRIMAVLDHNASTTVNELARYAMMEQSTLSRTLQRMEADGLLQSQKSPADARVRSITLTSKGLEQYNTVRSLTMKHVDRALHGLSRAERYQLMAIVTRMRTNVDNVAIETET